MSFINPIGAGLHLGRTDQGVDFTGAGPLYAIGSGTVVNTHNSGWPGLGTFIAIKLDSAAGLPSQYIYYAEDITPAVSVGQRVNAGQLIGHATGGNTGIEIGWAAPPGSGNTLAAAQGNTGGAGHSNSPMGQNFLSFLHTLGVAGQGAAAATGGGSGGGGTGLFSWPADITGFFGDAKSFIDGALWLVNPASWLRIGAFIAAVILMTMALYVFVKADSDAPLFPRVVPVPV